MKKISFVGSLKIKHASSPYLKDDARDKVAYMLFLTFNYLGIGLAIITLGIVVFLLMKYK